MRSTLASLARRYWKPALGVVVGAAAGWAYSTFVGCASGGCPLTSNPLIASGIGALLGLSIAGSGEGRKGSRK